MRTNSSAGRSAARVGASLCFFAIAVTWAGAVRAQKYAEITPNPNFKNWSAIDVPSDERRSIENMLKGSSSLDTTKFDAYFNDAVFPQFTLRENIFYETAAKGKGAKTTVCRLPDMRKKIKSIFFKDATDREARARLNKLTLEMMTKIAGGNFHPLARYNAMLLIADLNEDEATETPYKPALRILDIAAHHKALSDGVHVAALIGIVRHAKSEAGLDPSLKNQVTRNLVQLVNDNQPPANRSREGHDWMRRRALEGLVAIFSKDGPRPDGAFLTMLGNLLAETDSTMELRAEAVEALLAVKIVAPAKFDSAKMAAGIGQVAVDAYHRELETSLRLGRKIYPDGMKYYFTLVDRALSALDKAATTPKIAALQTSLATLSESLIPEEPEDPNIPVDPFLQENKIYDGIVQNGAKFESLVTGKPESEINPKRDPVGGNTGAVGGGGYGSGYGSTGRGGYGSTGRGGYGSVRAPAPPSRGGYGAYGGAR